ncbi:MAG: prolipoprotein diacylglyceryl transferase, partial [Enterobacter sp.]|nr:prolipoprotein diacylglyceryl transferase [Enterobacter sp.]
GDADDVVPPGETFRLQQALQREGLDSNLTCLWGAGVRHRITPEALEATVEFFRQPDAQFTGGWVQYISMGQILSIPMIVAGAIMMIWAYRRRPQQQLS